MKPLLLALIALVAALTACETDVEFVNRVPGATLTAVQWEPSTSDRVYAMRDPLLPGERSSTIAVYGDDPGSTGTLRIELEVEGNAVSLIAAEEIEVPAGGLTTIEVTPELEVHNELLPTGEE